MQTHTSPLDLSSSPRRRSSRGFTLVEMMVVISVVVLISAFLFVALRAARSGAGRAESLSALRALAMAHSSYSTEHRGRFIPAFVNQQLLDTTVPLEAQLADGYTVPLAARETWVWRLAPYMDHAWQTLYADADASTEAQLNAAYANRDLVGISQNPGYGLNGIFIGGDSDSGGGTIAAQSPFGGTTPTIAATRMTEVRTPTTLILFAPTRKASGSGAASPDQGWFELRAPFLSDRQWEVFTDNAGAVSVLASSGIDGGAAGIPFIRRNERTLPAGFLDGSASSVDIDLVANDMRSWAAQAGAPDWTVD